MRSFVGKIVKCIIVLCVFCGTAFAQTRPKAAVYIMGNPEGRDALRMAVNTFLVKSGKYQMVAVDAIDVVAKEQKRQMSGSVSDGDIAKLGRDAGAEYVCVVERADFDGYVYVATRMISVQSKVAEFADMVELPQGGKIIDIIQWQIGSMLGMAVGPRPGGAAQASTGAARPAPVGGAAPEARTTGATVASAGASNIQGTLVPGGSLAQKLTWLQKSADSHTAYIVEVNADEKIAPFTFEFSGGINITVVLRGVGGNRTVMLRSHGNMFTVKKEVTLILDNNITLRGHSGNSGAMVRLEEGALKMNAGSTITGNNNGDNYDGGGVFLSNGSFEMIGGTISGNTAKNGGGVCLFGGTFTMTSGIISGNNAKESGGGVFLSCHNGILVMRGGTISGNSARVSGGGIGTQCSNVFTKTGGTVTGYKSDPANGNVVKDEDGAILSRKGHAVYRDENKRKETTSGPPSIFKGDTGDWDQ
jgi:hypothetical protein